MIASSPVTYHLPDSTILYSVYREYETFLKRVELFRSAVGREQRRCLFDKCSQGADSCIPLTAASVRHASFIGAVYSTT